MGDGIRRILNILISIIDTQNGIVIIDEIENGLHFTSIKHLLITLIEFTKENNVQLFIASHNYEVLKYLNEILEDNDRKSKKLISCYSIKKGNNILKTYKYDFNQFNNAIN